MDRGGRWGGKGHLHRRLEGCGRSRAAGASRGRKSVLPGGDSTWQPLGVTRRPESGSIGHVSGAGVRENSWEQLKRLKSLGTVPKAHLRAIVANSDPTVDLKVPTGSKLNLKYVGTKFTPFYAFLRKLGVLNFSQKGP